MTYKRKKSYWQQDIRKREYGQALLKGILIIGIISYLFYGNLIYTILFSPYLIKYIKSWEKEIIKKKKQRFRMQFKEAIQSLSAALNVGYAVENAIGEVIKDLRQLYKEEEIILREFTYMARQIQMNVNVETALQEFAGRTGEEDVKTFAAVFGLAKRSGGDVIDIIRNTVRQMSAKIEVEREIKTLISAKQLEFRMMTMIPLAMMAYLKIGFPEFLQVLYGTATGVAVMSICLIIYVISYEMGKRMVEIEV